MKPRTSRMVKRWLSVVLCLCILSPSAASYVSAAEEPVYTEGFCEHHQEHTEECGYVEAVEGHP